MTTPTPDVIVVGAGPAGLATSRELSRAAVAHVVLERGPSVAHTWENLYEGLVLHTGKHFSALPGMQFPSETPLFPPRRDFVRYLHRYAAAFRVPVETGVEVEAIRPLDDGWSVQVRGGSARRARAVVVATGIVSSPVVPEFRGRARFRGTVMHSVEYRRPDPFRGQRVLVVGAGNSSGEICAELAGAGAHVTAAIRSGVRVVPRQLLGIPIQYFGVVLNTLPASVIRAAMRLTGGLSQRAPGASALAPVSEDSRCASVPLIGFHFSDAIAVGRIRVRRGVAEFTETGVRFADGAEDGFDHVILATGYRAAMDMLGDLIARDACGFAARGGRVASLDRPNLFFVGHNYDASGGLRNIARDARIAARLITGGRRGNGRT
jgi:cation diffusion facilitator CzcD-associated flavoprotein CzcO